LENEQIDNLSDIQKQELAYLTEQPNVILTPHIAGYSNESFYKMSAVILEKLKI
jgi:D-3-phosphoglycerate dehydrogenase